MGTNKQWVFEQRTVSGCAGRSLRVGKRRGEGRDESRAARGEAVRAILATVHPSLRSNRTIQHTSCKQNVHVFASVDQNGEVQGGLCCLSTRQCTTHYGCCRGLHGRSERVRSSATTRERQVTSACPDRCVLRTTKKCSTMRSSRAVAAPPNRHAPRLASVFGGSPTTRRETRICPGEKCLSIRT